MSYTYNELASLVRENYERINQRLNQDHREALDLAAEEKLEQRYDRLVEQAISTGRAVTRNQVVDLQQIDLAPDGTQLTLTFSVAPSRRDALVDEITTTASVIYDIDEVYDILGDDLFADLGPVLVEE